MIGGHQTGRRSAETSYNKLVFSIRIQSVHRVAVRRHGVDMAECPGRTAGVPHHFIQRCVAVPHQCRRRVGQAVDAYICRQIANMRHNLDIVNHQRGILARVAVVHPHHGQAVGACRIDGERLAVVAQLGAAAQGLCAVQRDAGARGGHGTQYLAGNTARSVPANGAGGEYIRRWCQQQPAIVVNRLAFAVPPEPHIVVTRCGEIQKGVGKHTRLNIRRVACSR